MKRVLVLTEGPNDALEIAGEFDTVVLARQSLRNGDMGSGDFTIATVSEAGIKVSPPDTPTKMVVSGGQKFVTRKRKTSEPPPAE